MRRLFILHTVKMVRKRAYTIYSLYTKKTIVNKFHIYGLEWSPDKLTFTLDRKPYYSFTKKEAEYWPFDVPYVLILNLAYGGWGAECGMDYSVLPKEMLIDWIRYYPLVVEE